jgi:hypothetical protein
MQFRRNVTLLSPGLAAVLGLIVGLAVLAIGFLGLGKPMQRSFGKSIDDGRWSVTNIQVILWTGVILGSYLALSMAAGSFLAEIPTNTLILVGIASGTLAFTSITNGLQSDSAPTTQKATGDFLGGFLASEKNPTQPSLIKGQMFAWNIIAILLFVTFVGSNLYNGNYTLPDVGATVSTILAISNGAHIATKPLDNKKNP